jgi:hypothetical protein
MNGISEEGGDKKKRTNCTIVVFVSPLRRLSFLSSLIRRACLVDDTSGPGNLYTPLHVCNFLFFFACKEKRGTQYMTGSFSIYLSMISSVALFRTLRLAHKHIPKPCGQITLFPLDQSKRPSNNQTSLPLSQTPQMHPICQQKQPNNLPNILCTMASRPQHIKHLAVTTVRYRGQQQQRAEEYVQNSDQDGEAERETLREKQLCAGASVGCAGAGG